MYSTHFLVGARLDEFIVDRARFNGVHHVQNWYTSTDGRILYSATSTANITAQSEKYYLP